MRGCCRGTLLLRIRARANETWEQWRYSRIAKKRRRSYHDWIARLQKARPEVVIGTNLAWGGVREHIHALKRYSSLRLELAPPDYLLQDFGDDLRRLFAGFAPVGIRAVHSHVFPWFINWCKKQRESGVRWIHTYHLNYFPEHSNGDLLPWQREVNEALLNVACHADVRISVARWQQEYLSKTHGIETIYIPNGVDIEFCDKSKAERFRKSWQRALHFICWPKRSSEKPRRFRAARATGASPEIRYDRSQTEQGNRAE